MSTRATISVVLALAVLASIWLVWRCRVPEIRSVTLPDGSVVRLRQVSFGRTHFPVDTSAWQRLLWRLPRFLTSSLGIRPRVQTTTNDTLVIWLEWLKGTNQTRYQPWIAVPDSHGLQSACVRERSAKFVLNSSNLFSFELTSIPRKERILQIDLYAMESWPPFQKMATFRLKNPTFTRRDPMLRSFPTSTNVLGQDFALVALHTGFSATGVLARVTSQQLTELKFKIGTNEPGLRAHGSSLQGDWTIHTVELLDRYGNRVFDSNPLGRLFPSVAKPIAQHRDVGIAVVRGSIWPNEIWSVRAEFVRNITPTLNPAESWSVIVPVPAAGDYFEIRQTRWIDGCEIMVQSIESDGASPPLLHVQYRKPARLLNAGILNAEDDLGRVVAASSYHSSDGEWFELHTAPGAKTVKVTFAVSRGAIVYLSAAAKIHRTNAAHWLHQRE